MRLVLLIYFEDGHYFPDHGDCWDSDPQLRRDENVSRRSDQRVGKLVVKTNTEASRKYQFRSIYETRFGMRQNILVRTAATTTKTPMPKTIKRVIFCCSGSRIKRSRGTSMINIIISELILKTDSTIS